MGLPIIFHFKSHGDPQDNTLVIDNDHDRMASPIITKALVVSPTEAYPLILALNSPPVPRKLLLQQAKSPDIQVDQGGVDAIEYLVQTAERDWKTKRVTL